MKLLNVLINALLEKVNSKLSINIAFRQVRHF